MVVGERHRILRRSGPLCRARFANEEFAADGKSRSRIVQAHFPDDCVRPTRPLTVRSEVPFSSRAHARCWGNALQPDHAQFISMTEKSVFSALGWVSAPSELIDSLRQRLWLIGNAIMGHYEDGGHLGLSIKVKCFLCFNRSMETQIKKCFYDAT